MPNFCAFSEKTFGNLPKRLYLCSRICDLYSRNKQNSSDL